MRGMSAALLALFAAASLSADAVTLPAAASIQGGNPFFSDVRVFNTSYTASLDVTGTYRCFIASVGNACPATPPQIHFTLLPRESRAFNDICAVAFGAPDTAGGVEFEFSGSENQLVVTSRLYSTAPFDSVGMFIPGLNPSKARAVTVLNSIRHDPSTNPPTGFRTNVGVFNPGDSSAVATFLVFQFDGAPMGTPVLRTVPAHSGVQVTGIFEAAGLANVSTSNAEIVVTGTAPLFSYAAVIDNRTADPIFVVGAPNEASGAVTPTQTPSGPTPTRTRTLPGGTATSTRTPTLGGPSPTTTSTRTPTIPGPTFTATNTPSGPTATNTPTLPGPTFTPSFTVTVPPTSTRTPTNTRTFTNTRTPTNTPLPNQVNIGPGSQFNPTNITITAGQTVTWVWMSSGHSTTSDTGLWDSGVHSIPFSFPHTFPTAGDFLYHCTIHGAPGGVGMSGVVHVLP